MYKSVRRGKVAWATYMREYTRKNKDRINAAVKARRLAKLSAGDETPLLQSRANNRRYHAKHREAVNARAKACNWNYDKDAAVGKRRSYYVRHASQISITSARLRAKKAGLPFDLTVKWFDEQFPKGCAVTRLPLDTNGSKTPWTAHVDRIVPSKGYVMSNCRLVCACYNLAKKHWADSDILRMARALIRTSDT